MKPLSRACVGLLELCFTSVEMKRQSHDGLQVEHCITIDMHAHVVPVDVPKPFVFVYYSFLHPIFQSMYCAVQMMVWVDGVSVACRMWI